MENIYAEHEELLKIVIKKENEDLGWTQKTSKPDCSCGCIWFHPLKGPRSFDWGVCFNPKSHRCGLLTFEHMGCNNYENG